MVKVSYKPWEEVVIHESIEYTFQNLVATQTLGVTAGQISTPLLWAEGVAFRRDGMPPTQDIIKEQLQGRIHWNSVAWTLMPEFKPYVEIAQTKVKIPLIDVGSNETLSDVARWLKATARQA